MFKKRKNKAPYLKHYCRGMTDRQIAEITDRSVTAVILWRKRNNLPPNPKGALRSKSEAYLFLRRLQIARGPEKERRIIRCFMSDLLRCAQYCPEPDVMEFMGVWREVKGGQQQWDAPNSAPAPKKGGQSRSA